MSARVAAVTGASGLIGRALSAHLAARGWEVRALVRDPAAFGPPPAGGRVGRCELPDTLDEALLADADVVVHCAYATRETDRERARRVNEDGTRRLLEASRRARVPRFVFVSTVAAQPEAPNYYARSKHALEGLCDPGRDLVVRPGLVLAREGHGIFQMMRDVARRTHLIPLFGGGRQPLQTVHLDDLCEAVARALERELTGALNVAEPAPLSMAAFLRAMVCRSRPCWRRCGLRRRSACLCRSAPRACSPSGGSARRRWRRISAASISPCARRRRAWRTCCSFNPCAGASPTMPPTGRPGGAEPLGPPADSAMCRP